MSLMKRLPEWKTVILKSIESCINQEQLFVCHEIIDLFENRYYNLIDYPSLRQHLDELWTAYHAKEAMVKVSA